MRSSELSRMYDQRKVETSHAKPHSAHWSVPELMSLIQRPEEMSQCGEEKGSEEDKLDCYCVNCGVYIHTARLLTKLLRSVKEVAGLIIACPVLAKLRFLYVAAGANSNNWTYYDVMPRLSVRRA